MNEDKYNKAIDSEIDSIKQNINNQQIDSLPSSGYTIPMLVWSAIRLSEKIVDSVPRYSTADHISIFKALNILIDKVQRRQEDGMQSYNPFFSDVIEIDCVVEQCVHNIYHLLSELNTVVSLREKYWLIKKTENSNILHISKQFRRSALNLLGVKCEYYSYDNSIRKYLDKKSFDPILLQINMGLRELHIYSKGVSNSWSKFMKTNKYSFKDLIYFQGFIAYLMLYGEIWFKYTDLVEVWHQYKKKYKVSNIEENKFEEMVSLYSLTPDKINDWGTPVPFITIGDWFIYWPYYYHIMDSGLLLTLLWMRKKRDIWNNTLGSDMAQVSTYLSKLLVNYKSVLKTSERKKQGLGDIDLAVYDVNSSHLLICEIKTVFDKFRTNYQYEDFRKNKVNVDKANNQLRRNYEAIKSGKWSINEIYNTKGINEPQKISMIILTWWDIFNPNIGTSNSDIYCCNFKTFKYLYEKANGEISLLVDSIENLSNIYCPARLLKTTINYENEKIDCIREVQTDALPPISTIQANLSNKLFKEEIESLSRFPEDWREQTLKEGEDPETWYFYS